MLIKRAYGGYMIPYKRRLGTLYATTVGCVFLKTLNISGITCQFRLHGIQVASNDL